MDPLHFLLFLCDRIGEVALLRSIKEYLKWRLFNVFSFSVSIASGDNVQTGDHLTLSIMNFQVMLGWEGTVVSHFFSKT